MKKLILFLAILIGQNFISFCQTLSPKVLATAGGFFSNGGVSLSWTMGETFTSTLQNGNVVLTQGEQQPYIELRLLNLKVFLEGFFNGSTGYMDNSNFGWLYVTNVSPNTADVDTVTVSAMDAVTKDLVGTTKGILKTDGSLSVKLNAPVNVGTSYYIKINQRNTIETWSAAPVMFSSVTTYDFSSAQSQAYGSNLVDVGTPNALPPTWALYSGDISDAGLGMVGFQDGIVESQDYGDMEYAVYVTLVGFHTEDLTGDGIVESSDYGLMENAVYFTRVAAIP